MLQKCYNYFMASIHKDARSPYYIAMFRVRGSDGAWKQVRRSTKIPVVPGPGSHFTSSELFAEAIKVANLYERVARGDVSVNHIRKVVSELAANSIQMPSISMFFADQLYQIRKTKTAETFRKYQDSVNRFLKFIEDMVSAPLDSITPQVMNDYYIMLMGRVRKSTAEKHLSYVKTLLSNAVTLDILPSNPAAKILKQSVAAEQVNHDVQRRAFTLEELHRVLDACDGEWRSMVLVSLYTGGQRLSDMANLKWSQVNFEKKILTLRTQKRGRNMVVPLWSRLEEHLQGLYGVRQSEFVHPHAAACYEKAGKSSTLSNEFGHLLFLCGLVPNDPKRAGKQYAKKSDNKRQKNELSFHSLRYSATTFMHEAGVPPMIVQRIVGHASAKVHEGYAAFNLADAESALSSLPKL